MAETVWREKTNKGRVVYDRKPHLWNDRDVERVVKAFADDQKSDVPMMSEIADRVLYWIMEKLSLDDVAGAAAKVVVRLFGLVRGFRHEPVGRAARVTKEEQELLDWMSEMAGGDYTISDRKTGLLQLRAELSSMIEYIDLEVPQ